MAAHGLDDHTALRNEVMDTPRAGAAILVVIIDSPILGPRYVTPVGTRRPCIAKRLQAVKAILYATLGGNLDV